MHLKNKTETKDFFSLGSISFGYCIHIKLIR